MLIVHGLGEHGGRYLHFPHFVRESVSSVYTLDLRGHGRSEGLRGHVERFDNYVDDAVTAIRRLDARLKQKCGKSEIHLMGHSMGGLASLRALFHHNDLPLKSASISAPLLGIRVPLPLVKRAAAHLLSRVWSTLHMDNEINAGIISRDPAVVEAYLKDRLMHHKGTPRLYTEMLQAIDDTVGRTTGIAHPVLFLVPRADQVVDPEATLRFVEALKHRDKELRIYPDFYHETFNDVGKEKPFEELNKWIKQHAATN